jgi:hypothetical protein
MWNSACCGFGSWLVGGRGREKRLQYVRWLALFNSGAKFNGLLCELGQGVWKGAASAPGLASIISG